MKKSLQYLTTEIQSNREMLLRTRVIMENAYRDGKVSIVNDARERFIAISKDNRELLCMFQ